MLFASGTLDAQLGGAPVAIKEDETGQVIVDGQQKRRSIYIRVRRSQTVAMLQSFDAPVMDVNCERRPVSTVATQSLILLNGVFTLQQSELAADRIINESRQIQAQRYRHYRNSPSQCGIPWRYGYGTFNQTTGKVDDFIDLPHWTDKEWQGGKERPDPQIGWVILGPKGGHTGGKFAAFVDGHPPKIAKSKSSVQSTWVSFR